MLRGEIKTKGWAEFRRMLAELPRDVRAEVEGKTLREVAQRMIWQAQARCRSEEVAEALAIQPSRSADGGPAYNMVLRNPNRKGSKVYVWAVLERGSRPHIIRYGQKVRQERLVTRASTRKGAAPGAVVRFRQRFLTREKAYVHPGHRAFPFIRPAFRSAVARARRILKTNLAEVLARRARAAKA